MDYLFSTPKHQDLIYDVGMHQGEDTEFYLRKGFRVVAFEADPDLARSCRKRLDEFVAQNRLTIIEGAIIDPATITAGTGTVTFYKDPSHSVWGTACASWAKRNEQFGASSTRIEVRAIDFSGIIQAHGIPHYMKVDIEGCDLACIHALKKYSQRPDYVSLESDKTSFANIKREIDLLLKLGYSSFQAIEQSAIPLYVSSPYPATEGEYAAQHFKNGSSGLFGSELGGKWKPRQTILRQYRVICLGYYLLGDYGLMTRWKYPGSRWLRLLARALLWPFIRAAVPGWYDTHARHSSVNATGGTL